MCKKTATEANCSKEKVTEPEFAMSLGSFKTIWKCPKCGKTFNLKSEKKGVISKTDIDVNYCSGCGTKFNWEDGD